MAVVDRSVDSVTMDGIERLAGDRAMNSSAMHALVVQADARRATDVRGARIALVAGVPRSAFYETTKRILDLAVGSLLLLIALPIMLATAILIRIDSPGPIVFRQDRIGRGGKPFKFFKFRTMYADARLRFPELYAYRFDPETVKTMRYKEVDDPRLTRVGRWLRRTSLDELPNLVNVLRGDVTLVGPRPEIYEWLPYYDDSQLVKFSVKPGVTGFAQVHGRSLLTFQQVLTEDVLYVHSRSLLIDMKVLALTVKEVLIRQGAF
jgi:lipopolysaccharide/colanic/teichoic acid biosynthesis glycosyltransferase